MYSNPEMFNFKTTELPSTAYTHEVSVDLICPYAADNDGRFKFCRGKKCMKWVWVENKDVGYCGRS
jgi:hypothetical protein